jgi:hypothetical protein
MEIPLVIIGARDLPDFHAIAGILEHQIQNARKVILPGVGHVSSMEDSGSFNEIVSGTRSARRNGQNRPEESAAHQHRVHRKRSDKANEAKRKSVLALNANIKRRAFSSKTVENSTLLPETVSSSRAKDHEFSLRSLFRISAELSI